MTYDVKYTRRGAVNYRYPIRLSFRHEFDVKDEYRWFILRNNTLKAFLISRLCFVKRAADRVDFQDEPQSILSE